MATRTLSIFSGLSKSQTKVLDALIYFCQWKTHRCWAKQETIAHQTGCTVKTVARSLAKLVEIGYGSYKKSSDRNGKEFCFSPKLAVDVRRLKNARQRFSPDELRERALQIGKKMSGQKPQNVRPGSNSYKEYNNTPFGRKKNSLTGKQEAPVPVFSCLKEIPIKEIEKEQLSRQCSKDDLEHGVKVLLKSYAGKALNTVKSIAGFIRRAGENRWKIPLNACQKENLARNRQDLKRCEDHLDKYGVKHLVISRGSGFIYVTGAGSQHLLYLDEDKERFRSILYSTMNEKLRFLRSQIAGGS